jgi:hypothetical protein
MVLLLQEDIIYELTWNVLLFKFNGKPFTTTMEIENPRKQGRQRALN